MGWPNNYVQGVYDSSGKVIGIDDGAGGSIGLARTYTWATKPLASAYIGAAFISDIGVGGSYWISNGTVWKPLNGHLFLESSAVAKAAHTGTVVETTIHTINLPAGIISPNGSYKITQKWTLTNNSNAKNAYVKLGATQLCGFAFPSNLTGGSQGIITNRNSASSQIGANGAITMGSSASASFNTGAIDTSAAHVMTLTMQLAVGTDSAVLEFWSVELIEP